MKTTVERKENDQIKTFRIRQYILKPAVLLQNSMPAAFFTRPIQLGIDAALTTVAVYLAYQLRFDAAVSPSDRHVMYFWMASFPVLRITIMSLAGVYQMTWRYFALSDSVKLSFAALLGSAVLLILRLALYGIPILANPISVIVIEAAVFLLLANTVRALRRLSTEEAVFSTGQRTRVLLVGADNLLPAAIHQIAAYEKLEVVGLVVPNCKKGLLGLRIGGHTVLGNLALLSDLLHQGRADLVMVADASLDRIGDVLAIATNCGVEVRLLPSAADVIRGDVRFVPPPKPVTGAGRVLVLGGAGYLGSTLVTMLLARGYKVRVLDRLLFGAESLSPVSMHPNFDLVVGDVRDIQTVVGAMKGCDAVINLAAIVGDPACSVNKQLSLEVNRAATRMLIDICKGYGISRFMFASTCSVYGAADYLVDELTEPAPISVYAETKVASEELLIESASTDFHPVILRLGTLFGLSPRPRFDLVVNLLTARAATAGKITVFNGEQWRPFLHVHDAARAFVLALEADLEVVSGEIFNVGDYRLNLRLSAISQKIAEIIPSVDVERVENGDKRNYRASFDKIHTRLGFMCEKTIESGIREISEAINSQQIVDFTESRFNNHLTTQAFAENDRSVPSTMRLLAKLAA